jgi:hypothetical protein
MSDLAAIEYKLTALALGKESSLPSVKASSLPSVKAALDKKTIKRFNYISESGKYEECDSEFGSIKFTRFATSYFNRSMRSSFESIVARINKDTYVCCAYYNDKIKTDVYSDTQPGITGKCMIGESYDHAVDRELREEIGVKLVVGYSPKIIMKRGVYNYYFIEASHVVAMKEKTVCPRTGRDDKLRRFAIFVTGTRDELCKLLSEIKVRDEIAGEVTGIDVLQYGQTCEIMRKDFD